MFIILFISPLRETGIDLVEVGFASLICKPRAPSAISLNMKEKETNGALCNVSFLVRRFVKVLQDLIVKRTGNAVN